MKPVTFGGLASLSLASAIVATSASGVMAQQKAPLYQESVPKIANQCFLDVKTGKSTKCTAALLMKLIQERTSEASKVVEGNCTGILKKPETTAEKETKLKETETTAEKEICDELTGSLAIELDSKNKEKDELSAKLAEEKNSNNFWIWTWGYTALATSILLVTHLVHSQHQASKITNLEAQVKSLKAK